MSNIMDFLRMKMTENSQYYFKLTHNDFTETKRKMDNFNDIKDLKVKSYHAKMETF